MLVLFLRNNVISIMFLKIDLTFLNTASCNSNVPIITLKFAVLYDVL